MILADTSAWVEFLRATGSPVHHRMQASIAEDGDELATTDVVLMEVLAGARDSENTLLLRRLLGRCSFLPVEGRSDWEAAAELFRRCRGAGETVRALTDCLIAAVAIRCDASVLHRDSDFDALARHAGLRVF